MKSNILLIGGGFLGIVGSLAGDILRFPVGIGGGCRDFDLFDTLTGELNLGLVCVLFFKVVEELKREFFVL